MTQLTGFKLDNQGAYIEKDPEAELDYTIDWTDWMVPNDEISTSTWSFQTFAGDAAPLTEYDSSYINAVSDRTTVYISGGTSGRSYRVTNTITTVSGLTDQRYFRLFLRDRTL